jgi:hypothetical protein
VSTFDDVSPNKKTGTWELNFGKALGTPRALNMYSISAPGISVRAKMVANKFKNQNLA